jgi:hypothetical protein
MIHARATQASSSCQRAATAATKTTSKLPELAAFAMAACPSVALDEHSLQPAHQPDQIAHKLAPP